MSSQDFPRAQIMRAAPSRWYRDSDTRKAETFILFFQRAPPGRSVRTPEEKVGSSHLPRLGPGPSSPLVGASLSRERSPKLLPRRRPTARAHLGAVPPGEGLGKPQEKRASERRHRRDSHGQQRRRAQPLPHLPPPGGSPAAPVRSQPPALHAGKGLPPLLGDFSPQDAQAPGRTALWDWESGSHAFS